MGLKKGQSARCKDKIVGEISELAELSFVGNKGKKQWIWLALDVETREIVGFHIGDRSEQEAKKFWDSLPSVYRQCAVAYTDF